MRVTGALLSAVAGALAASVVSGAALAQSMTPMRGEVVSVSDAFAVRIFPSNPYDRPIRVDVRVYDQDFAPVGGVRISASPVMLASGASRPVIVAIPFDGRRERKVRVCAESIPFPNSQTQVRAQICGKFLGKRAS
ncbi:hypothetical protein [Aureimonas sp. AU22]|uniref:hypothetical protein n=1 Tax=Aureimonas sp. AU22 TaxID=1638162 RepID=UPI000782E415|nr:hypothetical protein [Aureimonas sp. AU22]